MMHIKTFEEVSTNTQPSTTPAAPVAPNATPAAPNKDLEKLNQEFNKNKSNILNFITKMGWKDKLAQVLAPFKGCKSPEEVLQKAKELSGQLKTTEGYLYEGETFDKVKTAVGNATTAIWGVGSFATVVSLITIAVTSSQASVYAAIISAGVFAAGLIFNLITSVLGWNE